MAGRDSTVELDRFRDAMSDLSVEDPPVSITVTSVEEITDSTGDPAFLATIVVTRPDEDHVSSLYQVINQKVHALARNVGLELWVYVNVDLDDDSGDVDDTGADEGAASTRIDAQLNQDASGDHDT